MNYCTIDKPYNSLSDFLHDSKYVLNSTDSLSFISSNSILEIYL